VTPSHLPWGELKRDGARANVEELTGDSRPFPARTCKGGEFSVKKTSAGDRDPSVSIWSANTSSSSERMLTVMPVFFSKPLTSACVVCSCWPL